MPKFEETRQNKEIDKIAKFGQIDKNEKEGVKALLV